MTPSPHKPESSAKEYLVLILVILVGLPIAWKLGARDGGALAVKAYGETAKADAAAAASDDDYADEDEEGGGEGEDDASASSASMEASTPESVERGAAVYKANCVACHGEKGDGKGPAAVAFTPAPRDFTDPKVRWTQGREPAQIFATVSKGVEGTGMAGFAGALTEAQRWDLVHYVVSLGGAAAGKGSP